MDLDYYYAYSPTVGIGEGRKRQVSGNLKRFCGYLIMHSIDVFQRISKQPSAIPLTFSQRFSRRHNWPTAVRIKISSSDEPYLLWVTAAQHCARDTLIYLSHLSTFFMT